MTRVAWLTNILPSYRKGFLDALIAREEIDLHIYAQLSLKGLNFKTIHEDYPNHFKEVKAWCLSTEKFCIQFLPIFKLIKNYDVWVIDSNPRQLSHFLFATLLLLLRKRVILRGMIHSFQNRSLFEKIRLAWARLFPSLMVYTDEEVLVLKEKGFTQNIIGLNNGLDQQNIEIVKKIWSLNTLEIWKKVHGFEDKRIILSCARLIEKNHFEWAIKTFGEIAEDYPDVHYVLIGDGVQRHSLELLVKKLKLEKQVHFVGAKHHEEELAPFFLSAEFFIHPAAVGLSLMHAFGYSLPVLLHNDPLQHNPEFCAFEHQKTGLSFPYADLDAMKTQFKYLIEHPDECKQMGQEGLKRVQSTYNTQEMAKRFINGLMV